MACASFRASTLTVSNLSGFFSIIRSIAVPVRSQSGEVVAAINLAVHRSMVSMNDLVAHLGPVLKRSAGEISAHLGYRAGEV